MHGTIDLELSTGSFTYHPSAGYSGPDSFTFTVTDDSAAGLPIELVSTPGTVTIDVEAAVPSATPGAEIVARVLRIVGTSQADRVAITRFGNRITVTANFLPSGFRDFALGSIERIDARLREGNDRMLVARTVRLPAIIDAGDGNDFIHGGGLASVLLGGAGNEKWVIWRSVSALASSRHFCTIACQLIARAVA